MGRYYFHKVKDGLSTAIVFDVILESKAIPIHNENISFSVGSLSFISQSERIKEQELEYIRKGINRIAYKLASDQEIYFVLNIIDTQWSWADYQADLWELAIVEWASKVFNFEMPPYILTTIQKEGPNKFVVLWK